MTTKAEVIRELLHRTKHHDKDERYMAISDLKSEIESVDVLEMALQTHIRLDIFRRLDDASSDVQAIAINCLCSIVQKFEISQVVETVSVMGALSRTGDPAVRDMYSEGLRTILGHVPLELGSQVCALILPPTIESLQQFVKQRSDNDGLDEVNAGLTLLQCLFDRFPSQAFGEADAESILKLFLVLLDSDQDDVLPSVIGSFAGIIPSAVFDALMNKLIAEVQITGNSPQRVAALVSTIGCIARKAGRAVSSCSASLVPVLVKLATSDESMELGDEQEWIVAVKQRILNVFESLIAVGPSNLVPVAPRILDVAISQIDLDPNFDAESDQAMEQDFDDDGGDDDWGLEPDEFANEDAGDVTWKVRLASSQLLCAICECNEFSEIVHANMNDIVSKLLSRFNEREIAVQTHIFHTLTSLLSAATTMMISDDADASAVSTAGSPLFIFGSRSHEIVQVLRPYVVSSVLQTRLAAITVLNGMIRILTIPMAPLFSDILPLVIRSIEDISDDITIPLISINSLYCIVENTPSDRLAHTPDICRVLVGASSATAPGKVAAAALDALARVCETLRPMDGPYPTSLNAELASVSTAVILACKSAGDTHLPELQKASCNALAVFCARFGDQYKQKELMNAIELLLAHCESKNLRSSALQALIVLAQTPIQPVAVALQPLAVRVFTTLLKLLESGSTLPSSIQIQYVNTIDAFLARYAPNFDAKLLQHCLATVLPYSDPRAYNDIMLVQCAQHLSARLLASLAQCKKTPTAASLDALLDNCCNTIIRAESIPRATLAKTNLILEALAKLANNQAYANLISTLTNLTSTPSFAQSCLVPLATALAHCMKAGKGHQTEIGAVSQLIDTIRTGQSDTSPRLQLAMYTLGVVGSQQVLPVQMLSELFNMLLASGKSSNEQMKHAASFALGNCTAGNAAVLIPPILQQISRDDQAALYFLLLSLKEFFTCPNTTSIDTAHIEQILSLLVKYAGSADEGVRLMVAECLGKLFVLCPAPVLPLLESGLKSPSALIRATLMTAVKFSFSHPNMTPISLTLVTSFLQDDDIAVRRQTFLALTALLNTKPRSLLAGSLLERVVVPAALAEFKVRQELIRKIDFGAFHEMVDDGLLLRQSAYSCAKMLLEVAPSRVAVVPLVEQLLSSGVNDPDVELQCQAYVLLARTADMVHKGSQLSFFEKLPESLLPVVKKRLVQIKRDAKDPEARRVLFAFVRTMHALHNVDGVVNDCPKFHLFFQQVLKTALLADMLHEVQLQTGA